MNPTKLFLGTLSVLLILYCGTVHSTKLFSVSYFYPSNPCIAPDCQWAALLVNASSFGYAIINPDSGPGLSNNSDYFAMVQSANAAGLKLVGYVDTAYATRSIEDVEADVNSYYLWYPTISGIFFDEVTNDNCDDVTNYYKTLYQYVKGKNSEATVVINPGTNTLECYVNASDIILTFEDDYETYLTWSPDAWQSSYSPNRFFNIIYNVSPCTANQVQDVFNTAVSRNAGYVYITNLNSENGNCYNPYSANPSFLTQEINLTD